jgi:FkbH-like protein
MDKLREFAEQYIREEKFDVAMDSLLKIADKEPNLTNIHYICQKADDIIAHLQFLPVRIALLSSFTIEPLMPFLKVRCYQAGLKPEIFVGPYNQYQQEILQENSRLYQFNPEVVILFVRLEEICPELIDSFLELSPQRIEEDVAGIINNLRQLIAVFRRKSKSYLIIHNFLRPYPPAYGIADCQMEYGQSSVFARLNGELAKVVCEFKDVFVFDYDLLVSEHGRSNWLDWKMHFYANVPFNAHSMNHLAAGYMRFLKPIKGISKKCLVLDLDGVLWGGIIGEDGIEGVQLGKDYPGNVYRDFQKEILKLYNKGVILAINSKNNKEDVMELFQRHPDMILRKEHFASMRINWKDKASNMKEIAQELNIGLDSMIFIDDSPVERELIRQKLPGVKVIELPQDPSEFSQFLANLDDFESVVYSEEDKKRGQFYRARVLTQRLKEETISLDDFYYSLQMVAIIKLADDTVIPRLAQMTQRTNQFNLTTKRYTETDILRFANSKEFLVYYLRLKDRFTDNGIVGETILIEKDAIWEIDTFLLSCRVMGRTVETAFLSHIVAEARKNNIKYLLGRYIPTKKNKSVKHLYQDHGFKLFRSSDDGEALWRFDLEKSKIDCPAWITIKQE